MQTCISEKCPLKRKWNAPSLPSVWGADLIWPWDDSTSNGHSLTPPTISAQSKHLVEWSLLVSYHYLWAQSAVISAVQVLPLLKTGLTMYNDNRH